MSFPCLHEDMEMLRAVGQPCLPGDRECPVTENAVLQRERHRDNRKEHREPSA